LCIFCTAARPLAGIHASETFTLCVRLPACQHPDQLQNPITPGAVTHLHRPACPRIFNSISSNDNRDKTEPEGIREAETQRRRRGGQQRSVYGATRLCSGECAPSWVQQARPMDRSTAVRIKNYVPASTRRYIEDTYLCEPIGYVSTRG
jgi:hypothetical protein